MANRENIDKWIAALRSGEFKQGRGQLLTNYGGYCCLGVACEVYRRENGGEWIDKEIGSGETQKEFKGSAAVLPVEVEDWLGISSHNPMLFDSDNEYHSATDLNDSFGYTFDQIADAIERTYAKNTEAGS